MTARPLPPPSAMSQWRDLIGRPITDDSDHDTPEDVVVDVVVLDRSEALLVTLDGRIRVGRWPA